MPVINPATGLELLQFQGAKGNLFSAYNESTFEDFNVSGLAGGGFSNFWTTSVAGGSVALSASETDHPGIVAVSTGVVATSAAHLLSAFPSSNIFFPSGPWEWRTMLRVPTLSTGVDRFATRHGIFIGGIAAEPSSGIYFEYTDTLNGGNWTATAAEFGVREQVNTGVAVVAGEWRELRINGNAGSSIISYYIDNVLLASISNAAVIPFGLATLGLRHQTAKSVGANPRFVSLDYVYYAYSFTVGR